MPNQELNIKFSGLYTAPSAYGSAPDGALKTADNVVIRSPGVVEPRPGFVTQSGLAGLDQVWAMFDYLTGVTIGHPNPLGGPYTDTVYYSQFDIAVKNTEGTPPTWTRGRIQGAASRKNLYLTASDCLRKCDGTAADSLQRSGAPPPLIAVTDDSTAGGLVNSGEYY